MLYIYIYIYLYIYQLIDVNFLEDYCEDAASVSQAAREFALMQSTGFLCCHNLHIY